MHFSLEDIRSDKKWIQAVFERYSKNTKEKDPFSCLPNQHKRKHLVPSYFKYATSRCKALMWVC